MRIQNNIMAMNAHRSLGQNNNATAKSLEKLSSGYRINRAGDDAAGLAISEKMRAQIKGLETAQKNANDGISLVQTAEGALTEVHSMLNRMSELATQSANGTYQNEVDREALQSEVNSLRSEIDRISSSTNFNGIKLLDGSLSSPTSNFTIGTAGTTAPADGTASTLTIDLSKVDIKAGASIKIGNTTFEFVANAADVTAGNTAVVMGADKDAALTALATAVTTALDGTGANQWGTGAAATATNGVLTITSADPKGDATTPEAAYTELTVSAKGFDLGLQVGDTAEDFQKVAVSVGDMSKEGLGIDKIDIGTQAGAAAAMDAIKNAINTVSSNRADLGAVQNRLEHTVNNLGVQTENIQAAESRIRDVDMAKEMMTFTKNNILTQAAQAMLAQANQQPQGVLQLLR